MIINITPFASKSAIKPVLQHVYVYRKDDKVYTVATDSYKLACIEYTDNPTAQIINEGYYTAKDWADFCKENNKKTSSILSGVEKLNKLTIKTDTLDTFPDWERILAGKNEWKHDGLQHNFTGTHLIDFIKMASDKLDSFKIKDIKSDQTKGLYCYENEKSGIKTTLLLMAMNK